MAQAASHQLLPSPSAPCLLGAECLCTWGYNDTRVCTVNTLSTWELTESQEMVVSWRWISASSSVRKVRACSALSVTDTATSLQEESSERQVTRSSYRVQTNMSSREK